MSIATELQNYADGLDDSYDAVDDMGGVIPAHKNMANLDQAIRTIPQNPGATYTAGNGINIDANNEISIDTTVVAEVTDLPGDMTGATSQIAGAHGLVPAPAAGDNTKFLSGDGTWKSTSEIATFYFTDNIYGPNTHISLYSDQAKTIAVPASDVVAAYKRGKVILVGSHSSSNSESYELVEVDETTNSYVYLVAFGRERNQVTWAYSTPSSTTTMSFLKTQMSKKLIAGSNITLSSDVNATTISATDTTYSAFTGATSSVAGAAGLVPAPVAGDQGKVLTGGGSWTDIFNLIYPVGSIYMSVNNTDPGTLFGGTWTQIQDSFILAAGTTYTGGSTGGSATINLAHSHTVNSHNHSLPANTGSHTLTVDEIPSHSHTYPLLDVGDTSTPKSDGVAWQRRTYWNYVSSSSVGGGGGHKHSIGGNTGDKSPGTNSQLSSTQSILPPYLAVYVWKRTA